MTIDSKASSAAAYDQLRVQVDIDYMPLLRSSSLLHPSGIQVGDAMSGAPLVWIVLRPLWSNSKSVYA